MGISAYLLEVFARLPAIPQSLLNVLKERLLVTWDQMLDAGRGITAYPLEVFVLPLSAILQHLPNVLKGKWSVTMDHMLDAGRGISVC